MSLNAAKSRALWRIYDDWIQVPVAPRIKTVIDAMPSLPRRDRDDLHETDDSREATQRLIDDCVIPLRLFEEFFKAVEQGVSVDVAKKMEMRFLEAAMQEKREDGACFVVVVCVGDG